MRYPWITVLLLIAVITAALIFYLSTLRKRRSNVAWLANTEALRTLPAYRAQQRKARTGAITFVGLASVVALAVSIVAGAPVERYAKHPTLASRDIVLCLDASGSMLPYDGQILRQFDELVEHFQGERLSLQMWSAQTVVKFPLTDDYELVSEELHEAASLIDHGYLGPQGDYVLVTPELSDYLTGIEAPEGQMISSLVGDGLATCVLGFDHMDSDRSRTILLATDNEVMGEQIYSLAQAAKFATDHDIEIVALYPSDHGALTAEGEQLRNVVESSGGVFYNASDPSAIEGIVDQIQASQLVDTEGEVTTVETDRPYTALMWGIWAFLAFLMVAAVRRL